MICRKETATVSQEEDCGDWMCGLRVGGGYGVRVWRDELQRILIGKGCERLS